MVYSLKAFNFYDEQHNWLVYTRNIFQFLREEAVTTSIFLCFIKKDLATRFRLIEPSLGLIRTRIKKGYVELLICHITGDSLIY
jgi:hypothetical protein